MYKPKNLLKSLYENILSKDPRNDKKNATKIVMGIKKSILYPFPRKRFSIADTINTKIRTMFN